MAGKYVKIEEAVARVISTSFYLTNYLSVFAILQFLCFLITSAIARFISHSSSRNRRTEGGKKE